MLFVIVEKILNKFLNLIKKTRIQEFFYDKITHFFNYTICFESFQFFNKLVSSINPITKL